MCSNINRLTAHKRHFPLILRAAGLLLIVLIAAIAGTTLITRAARTGADCLETADDSIGPILIDPYTKRVIKVNSSTTTAPVIPTAIRNEPYLVSPDGKHVAYLSIILDTMQPSQLIIHKLDIPEYERHLEPHISWSPSGQWVVAITNSDENTYFVISDVEGLNKKMLVLDSSKTDYTLGDWGADQYLTVLESVGFTLWHVPDLKPVVFDAATQTLLKTCKAFDINMPGIFSTVSFSPNKRYLTCNAGLQTKAQVIIVDLDKRKAVSFDFPPNYLQTLWSADARYLAVSSSGNSTESRTLSVDIIDMVASRVHIGDVYRIDCADCLAGYAAMSWSFDGKNLIYLRHSQYEVGKLDMMLYHVDTQAYQYLFTIERPDSFNVLTSLNNQSVVWILYTTLDTSQSRVRLLFMSNLASVDFPVAGLYGVDLSSDGNLLTILSADLTDQQHIDFFDKRGAFMYRVKVKIRMGDGGGDGLTWTQCNPNA